MTYHGYDLGEVEYEHGYHAGYDEAKAEFQERIAELENQVEEMADGGERTCKLIVREGKEGIVCSECWTRHSGKIVNGVIFRTDPIDRYCRYCGSRITNPVDASLKYPHLTDVHFAEAADAYERLFNDPMGD